MKWSMYLVMLGASLAAIGQPQEPVTQGSDADKIRNCRAPFAVKISVDKPDRTYYEGETLTVVVRTSRKGYLYLFNKRPDGQCLCIFPNKFQQDNSIEPEKEVVVPVATADFVFRIRPPFGREKLVAFVFTHPVKPVEFGVASLTEAAATPVDLSLVKGVTVEENPRDWAEDEIEIQTLAKGSQKDPRPKRRVAFVFGVGKFKNKHPLLRPLDAPQRDVAALKSALERFGRFDEIIILIDEQATAEAIRKAICETLVQKTRPGDEVFIYFSGHGGRCADVDGDEQDGLDEYLVPHDGGFATSSGTGEQKPDRMILDDEFGRWVQELDARVITVIVDACYAGGQSQHEKGVSSAHAGASQVTTTTHFDFLDDIDREMARFKDLGHQVAFLASCRPSQVSVVDRKSGLSVMTRFLVEYIHEQPAPVTLKAVWEHLARVVPEYVEREYQLRDTQTPRLINEDLAERIVIKVTD